MKRFFGFSLRQLLQRYSSETLEISAGDDAVTPSFMAAGRRSVCLLFDLRLGTSVALLIKQAEPP